MSSTRAHVEFDDIGPVRVFRTAQAAAVTRTLGLTRIVNRTLAVRAIRRRVFERDGWLCVHCSNPVIWKTGHMHERQHRGDIQLTEEGYYSGGEISLENSVCLCYSCHLNDPVAGHGKRNPQFSDPNATL